MKLTNARDYGTVRDASRITVYIIITGADKHAVGFQWFDHWPSGGWLAVDDYQEPIYLTYEGVRFGIFDYLPLKSNVYYQAVMKVVLNRCGLDGA